MKPHSGTAGAELAVPAVAGRDLGLALDDDQEADSVLAVDDDLRAFLVADLAHLLVQLLQAAFGQALEQADRLLPRLPAPLAPIAPPMSRHAAGGATGEEIVLDGG